MLFHVTLSNGDQAIVLANKVVVSCDANDPELCSDMIEEAAKKLSEILGIQCDDAYLEVKDLPAEWNWDDVIEQLAPVNGQYLVVHSLTETMSGSTNTWTTVDNIHAINGAQPSHLMVNTLARDIEFFGSRMMHTIAANEAKIGVWYWSPAYPGNRFLVKIIGQDGNVYGEMINKGWKNEVKCNPDAVIQEFAHWKILKDQPKPGEQPKL